MTWRGLGWGAVVAIAIAMSWLWPRLDPVPTDFEIAVDYLNEQQPELALLFFQESTWRGVAAYRAGRYAQASRMFLANETVLSLYNLGNSYAHLRDWPNAIAAYQRVLRFDPDHADARHNLALVQKASALQEPSVAPADVPEEPPLGGQARQTAIPQEGKSQGTQQGETENSDTAGNTGETDQVGDTDETRRPEPVAKTGEVGRAAAVGQSEDNRGRKNRRRVGTVDLRQRNSTRPADVLLSKIHDDPEKVLRARILSMYESRIEGAAE